MALITQLQATPEPTGSTAGSTDTITPSVATEVAAPAATITLAKPISAKTLQNQLKAIVEADSGDPTVNWAFKTASRL